MVIKRECTGKSQTQKSVFQRFAFVKQCRKLETALDSKQLTPCSNIKRTIKKGRSGKKNADFA